MLDRICDQLISTTDVVSWVFHCDFINFIPVNTWQMCSLIISDHSPNNLVYIVIYSYSYIWVISYFILKIIYNYNYIHEYIYIWVLTVSLSMNPTKPGHRITRYHTTWRTSVDVKTITGWWLTYPSEKYESQLGWWHSQYMEKWNMFQTTNQICWHICSSKFTKIIQKKTILSAWP